ncbi:MAG: fibronectin type III domain-containing protein, partial [Nitrosotalea sp.]
PVNTGGTQSPGYQIGRSTDGGNTWSTTVTTIMSTTFGDVGLTPNTSYMYRVSAVNQAGTSTPSNTVTAVTLQTPGQTTTSGTVNNSSSTLSLDELLKQRLADAQRLQELLHGSNPSSPSAPSGSVHTIQLSEKMSVNDSSPNLGMQSANVSGNNPLQNGTTNFVTSLVIYPIISLVGVGIVVYILYLRKKRKPLGDVIDTKKSVIPSEVPSNQNDDDYAMMILKNRLAKGEITVDEFKALKDELSEP